MPSAPSVRRGPELEIHAALTTLRRYFPLAGAGAFFVSRCLLDTSSVATGAGLAAVLVSTALVYVLLAGGLVIVRVARRIWLAVLSRPYYTADADAGGSADRRRG